MKYTANPVISLLGRPIRLAVAGGGPDSFIGRTHRIAARLDGRYDIMAEFFRLILRNPDEPVWNWDYPGSAVTPMFRPCSQVRREGQTGLTPLR